MTRPARRPIQVADPPRPVPFAVQAHALFGGVVGMLGWLFAGTGLVFALIFVGNSEVLTWIDFRGQRATTVGTVEHTRATTSSENERPIIGVSYRYQVDGRHYAGESYATTVRKSVGEEVKVEYLVAAPAESRIVGMRRRHFGGGVVSVLIFPCVGLGFVLFTFPGGLRARRLLRIGLLGWGRLISREPTRMRVNKQPVYRLTFRFADPRAALPGGPYRGGGSEESGAAGFKSSGTSYQVVCKTHEVERVTDEDEEPLLFDPDHPERAVMLDSLPGHTRFDAQGQLTTDKSPWLVMAGPIMTALALVVAVMMVLF